MINGNNFVTVGSNDIAGIVGRTVVNDYNFSIVVSLIYGAVNCFGKKAFVIVVVDNYDDDGDDESLFSILPSDPW